uniref:Uncharacterized protein n=1 Tax=Ciona savignyi TaxID=51511 RepID=H2YKW5_CIOSA
MQYGQHRDADIIVSKLPKFHPFTIGYNVYYLNASPE